MAHPPPPLRPPPSFLPPADRVFPDLTPSALSMLFTIPLPWAQVCIPGLEKLTQQEIRDMLSRLLLTPPAGAAAAPVVFPWDLEEDFVLVAYLQSDQTRDVLTFLGDLGSVLHPMRTLAAISGRLAYLGGSEELQNQILERWAKESALEDRLFKSITATDSRPEPGRIRPPHAEQCVCMEWNPPPFPLSPGVDVEIARLQGAMEELSADLFEDGDLAILRADSIEFVMRESSIVIGRGTRDTWPAVSLGFLSAEPCPHISREHACIQLMSDGSFYVENIGSSIFRVNGHVIRPKQHGQITAGALLDFAGLILMFIPNDGLVNRIMAETRAATVPDRRVRAART
jgi:hypothetical protein